MGLAISKYTLESETGYCTVNTVDPVVPTEFAPITLDPAAIHWLRPATLGAFAMVATLADDELQ
jgi:hypothetical protein